FQLQNLHSKTGRECLSESDVLFCHLSHVTSYKSTHTAPTAICLSLKDSLLLWQEWFELPKVTQRLARCQFWQRLWMSGGSTHWIMYGTSWIGKEIYFYKVTW
ncbi:hypothetical protein GOODEAATRI_004566, partial [Goodea atripinnis]